MASKFLAVGAVVPAARAGVGAIATQAFANVTYRRRALDALAAGADATTVLAELTESDDDREQRQAGLVDARGGVATFTGSECMDWAGGRAGEGYCCQGNILTGAAVVDDMVSAFEASEGELASRLVNALVAGYAAGGDARGMQSAALLVVRQGGGYLGGTDETVNLRTDDHPDAVHELERLFSVHQFYFPRPEALQFEEIDERLASEMRGLLGRLGYEAGSGRNYDKELKNALFDFVGTENLEQRWSDEGRVDREVVAYLRRTAQDHLT
ncbi:MAG: DUF1028 domain-containing protein [Actinomycetota bacterium]|nr:DUF1028 domain-containing protein [Actinomycetota bacterium]